MALLLILVWNEVRDACTALQFANEILFVWWKFFASSTLQHLHMYYSDLAVSVCVVDVGVWICLLRFVSYFVLFTLFDCISYRTSVICSDSLHRSNEYLLWLLALVSYFLVFALNFIYFLLGINLVALCLYSRFLRHIWYAACCFSIQFIWTLMFASCLDFSSLYAFSINYLYHRLRNIATSHHHHHHQNLVFILFIYSFIFIHGHNTLSTVNKSTDLIYR